MNVRRIYFYKQPIITGMLLCAYFSVCCPQSTADQNLVAYRTYINADKKMLDLYDRLLKAAGNRDYSLKTALANRQKAFLVYRQKEGAYQDVNFKGGSMLPVFKYRALKILTDNRIKQLEYYAGNL